jgi:MoaA/NifB/PqqE/SkfB family radical SAM enzyme
VPSHRVLEPTEPGALPPLLAATLADPASMQRIHDYGIEVQYALLGPQLLRVNPVDFLCNATCPMCWQRHLPPGELKRQRKQELQSVLTIDEYEKLLRTVPPGLEAIELVGGGEPLLHPDACELMRRIRQRGIRGQLISNGILLTQKLALAMVEMGWNHVRISVNAADRETYRIVNGVDRFDVVVQNLATYHRLRAEAGATRACEMQLFFVLQRANLDGVGAMLALAREVGADSVVFELIRPFTEAERLLAGELLKLRESFEKLAGRAPIEFNSDAILRQIENDLVTFRDPSPETAGAALDPVDAVGSRASATEPMVDANVSSLAGSDAAVPSGAPTPDKEFIPGKACVVGFKHAFITAQGNVQPCCFSPEVMGNIREQDFSEIWYGEPYCNFRKRLANGQFSDYCKTNWCALPEVIPF